MNHRFNPSLLCRCRSCCHSNLWNNLRAKLFPFSDHPLTNSQQLTQVAADEARKVPGGVVTEVGNSEGNPVKGARWRRCRFRIRFIGRPLEAENVCRTFWRGAVGGTGNFDSDRDERWETICQPGGTVDDRGSACILLLRLRRKPVAAAEEIAGAAGHEFVTSALVRLRFWSLLRGIGVGWVIKFDTSRLGESRWYEYLVRFIFGGCVTALAGLIAKRYGATVGGLFLAFPAIFPATATLIEKHEKDRKEREGKNGAERARMAVGLDATGAAIGAVALIVFAAIVWRGLPESSLSIVLPGAMVAWMIASGLGWMLWRLLRKNGRVQRRHAAKHA